MLSDDEIVGCLSDYGVHASALQCEKIRAYVTLLLKWNRTISLTSVKKEAEILRFHFGESVFALPAVSGIHGRLADVGTGAGFPGIPLRIFDEHIDLLLIESNAKKCAFLNEAVRELGLDGTHVLRARYGDESESLRASLEIVVSRALGGYAGLLSWSSEVLAPAGKVILWLGEEDAQQVGLTRGWLWQPEIPIPGARRRVLLTGSPSKQIKS